MLVFSTQLCFKGLVAGGHSFCLFFVFYNIHTFIHRITFILYIYPSPFAGASLHFFIACELSGKNLPVVPSRESNSGLPYSKPTCFVALLPPFHFSLVQLSPPPLPTAPYTLYTVYSDTRIQDAATYRC
jgi:hypothetical protein